ncbi:hypothetical protein MKK63_05440 [Methylobacterium sp. J-088]|uniref:hypothetical protein n=1 Tax=Methylobacterium sp. J-088 TaxID=2836664 RepID=UPI001FBA23C5|nr:hypothetical protein [Methylobacterium sp. J-088]MCJ2062145.1 hypothetical protein [Methylobacterium sp. J-088]
MPKRQQTGVDVPSTRMATGSGGSATETLDLHVLRWFVADPLNIAHRNRHRERLRISFPGSNPDADPNRLTAWLAAQGLPVRIGTYFGREFNLDVPSSFVVAAMLPNSPLTISRYDDRRSCVVGAMRLRASEAMRVESIKAPLMVRL